MVVMCMSCERCMWFVMWVRFECAYGAWCVMRCVVRDVWYVLCMRCMLEVM